MRRLSIFGGFTINRAQNNSDGPFSIPASNGVADEWGPSGEDIRYRYNFSVNSGALRNWHW